MTNNEIIYEAVSAAFSLDQIDSLVKATYTAEQISARRACIVVDVDPSSDRTADDIINAVMLAESFHTYQERRKLGYQVKQGQRAALVCGLWRYTDKPGTAVKAAAAEAGEDTPENDPHFYLAKSHLFSRLQVEKAQPVAQKSREEIMAYNRMLAEQRRAAKISA